MTSFWWCRKCSSIILQPFKTTSRVKVSCGESIDWCWWWTLKIMTISLCMTETLCWRCFRLTWWIGWIDGCCWIFILTVLNEGFLVSLWVSTIIQSLMNWITSNLHWEIVISSGNPSASDMFNISAVNLVTLLFTEFCDALSHELNKSWLLLSEQWWALSLNWSWLLLSEQWWFWLSDWQWIYLQDEKRFIKFMRFDSFLSWCTVITINFIHI